MYYAEAFRLRQFRKSSNSRLYKLRESSSTEDPLFLFKKTFEKLLRILLLEFLKSQQ